MLKELVIQNFQSHKDSHLEFHPGVNIIVGTSDSGKSAIIRALRWAIKNKPNGDSIRSYWGGITSVALHFVNGILTRSRDKADKYIIEQTTKLELEAFRTTVPDEVVEFLKIDDVNLQFQHDPPFLINASSGEVASYFNKIAQLEKIDKATTNINSWILEITRTIGKPAEKSQPATGLIKKIEDLNGEIKTYDYLPEFEQDIISLEEIESRENAITTDLLELEDVLNTITQVNKKITETAGILELEVTLNEIFALEDSITDLSNEIIPLNTLINNIKNVDQNIQQNQTLLALEKEVDDILTVNNTLSELIKGITQLDSDIQKIKTIEQDLLKEQNTYKQLHVEFDEVFPDICPLCDTKIVKNGKK